MILLFIKKKVSYLGVILAFSLILSYIEFLIPIDIGVPGIKLGLSNLAVLICLYLFGAAEAILISIMKALLSSLLFGNATTIIYSLGGALISVIVMVLLERIKIFHIVSVSAMGGVFHNIGQITIAFFIIRSYSLIYYIPVLVIAGILTGIVIGLIAGSVISPLKKIISMRGDQL